MKTDIESIFAQYIYGDYELEVLLEHLVFEVAELKSKVEKLENRPVVNVGH